MSVLKLVAKTENAIHWSPQDVLEEALREVKSGKIGAQDRLVVISVGPRNSGEFNTHFLQCGMSASDLIMLLEIAKLDVYRNQMVTSSWP